ncbi:DUF6879 family protein [Streptomyces alanosinicus]|uniref:DUF6879 family protein n=1 Tax=Streptomyces alanosinicus TaxID=68171 RepID=UPI003570CD4D
MVILGTFCLYELRYKPDGIIAGAYRHTNRALVEACRSDFQQLYASGEDFSAFHARVTGPLLRVRREGSAS